jgi:transposase
MTSSPNLDQMTPDQLRAFAAQLLSQVDSLGHPLTLQLHLIVDNYATHKHPKVKAWLEKHKRFHMHFTPTSSSWMNMAERFFRDITVYLRDGSFSSVRELESSITTFLALRNAQPTRYAWNAKGEDILNKIQRARETMASQA